MQASDFMHDWPETCSAHSNNQAILTETVAMKSASTRIFHLTCNK